MNLTQSMQTRRERKKIPIKSVYSHVIRAKLFGVLTANALEGIVHEIDELLPRETMEEPMDVFSDRFRRYRNGSLMPTSYGDHLDRAAKSLCKDLGVKVTIELFNTQAIKKVIGDIIQSVAPGERAEMIRWLTLSNDIILKSERYENLINDVCMYYYKESVNNINEDTLSFVRRSANELLRNKASKEALRKKLLQSAQTIHEPMVEQPMQGATPLPVATAEMMVQRQPYPTEVANVDPNHIPYMIATQVAPGMMNKGNMTDFIGTFLEFFEEKRGDNLSYAERFDRMLDSDERRLIINIDDVRMFDSSLSNEILRNPIVCVEQIEKELDRRAKARSTKYLQTAMGSPFHVGFTGSMGSHVVSPRDLKTDLFTQMVCLEGIVTKTSLVRPKILRSVHYCPEGRTKYYFKEYVDMLSASENRAPTTTVIPTSNGMQETLEFEYGYSTYVNVQTISVQEMPERAPFGQLPRSVDVLMDYDLVDKVKPGDRVRVYGIYKPIAPNAATIGGSFRSIIRCNNIQIINSNTDGLVVDASTIKQMKQFATKKEAFDILAASIAPSIRGHTQIKRALVLQMIGGREHNLDNGIHLRGDINILLVGDPSCGKSQMLRFILNTVPLAVNTTGRGSSGVGLTAAVVKDQETGERRLEAGAMVLADRGIVCIDEFDKMSESDRVAIHEVMEQQTVTVAKAGIHCSLNARCSVLAAANPVYGQYDISKRPQENVGLPDSLLSRFDLLFIVRDEMDASRDRDIAEHVLEMNRYVRPGHENIPETEVNELTAEEKEDKGEMFVKSFGHRSRDETPILTTSFLKKYIDYAKARRTELTDEAVEFLVDAYAQLRQKSDAKTLPITARLLETLIRLSTAHAKLRLSNKVELDDCKEALDLVSFALYHDVSPTSNANLDRMEEEEEDENNSSDDDDDKNKNKNKKSKKAMKEQHEQEIVFSDGAEEEDEDEELKSSKKRRIVGESSDENSDENSDHGEGNGEGENDEEEEERRRREIEYDRSHGVDPEMFRTFRAYVSKLYIHKHVDQLTHEEVVAGAQQEFNYPRKEVEKMLVKMHDYNMVYCDNGIYYRI